jgi:hypothetical protein
MIDVISQVSINVTIDDARYSIETVVTSAIIVDNVIEVKEPVASADMDKFVWRDDIDGVEVLRSGRGDVIWTGAKNG